MGRKGKGKARRTQRNLEPYPTYLDRRLLPQPLSEEEKEETRRMMEENASLTEERCEDGSQGEACCVATVRSNYNLGITE